MRSVRLRTLFLIPACLLLVHCSTVGDPEEYIGVPFELAQTRKAALSQIEYALTVRVPEAREEPVSGSATISFHVADPNADVILDFKAPRENLESVSQGGRPTAFSFERGQIRLPSSALVEGRNRFEFSFRSADSALTRDADYLYTLLVPDRASTLFPCFDQPDLKARYRLVLNLPGNWRALSNAAEAGTVAVGSRRIVSFAPTEPLSTYQFAFAAGLLEVVEGSADGRSFRFFHRETDGEKVERNRDALFHLHAQALRWLEEYTGVDYPYSKFEFFLVPGFQFGGMEHPGAVFYRDTTLLLESAATQKDEMDRAHLIAHETAHMWFGDLVTMKWFDDVWMKEVFANFMAARMVEPEFPEVRHDVNFFLSHHPTAYEVERSEGTHPIRQTLANLSEAADLYGPIIYQKAPVVMRQLELIVGEENLRRGLQDYLNRFRFTNADWRDLIGILDPFTEEDLGAWSRRWVEESGRPTVSIERLADGIRIRQEDPAGDGRLWTQSLAVGLFGASGSTLETLVLRDPQQVISRSPGSEEMVVPGCGGLAYGRFRLDPATLRLLPERLHQVADPLARAVVWTALFDGLLEGEVSPDALGDLIIEQVSREEIEQLLAYELELLERLFWRIWPDDERLQRVEAIERLLFERIESDGSEGVKLQILRSLSRLALTTEALRRLERVWQGTESIEGLELGENDLTRLAEELALREPERAEEILLAQRSRISDTERKARLDFLRPVFREEPEERRAFVDSLSLSENRKKEPWVLDALRLLHHPLRNDGSTDLLSASLDLLPEVHRTGSIFFSKRWLDSVLWGYRTRAAAEIVEQFLAQPDLVPRLRLKGLQSGDYLFRLAGLETP